uniref:response regulator transcription factor n=1 Tax=Herbaspirillum lusitanum TaxID=213312 RepID=UPI0004945854
RTTEGAARQHLRQRFRAATPADVAASPTAAAPAEPSTLLSAREKEVLDFITRGFTAQEIAKLMQLSPFTVRTFVRRIYSKLKVTSKTEAIYEARTLGLLPD